MRWPFFGSVPSFTVFPCNRRPRERGPVRENTGLGVHFYPPFSLVDFLGWFYWPSFFLSEICGRTPADPTRPTPTSLSERR